MRTYIMKMAGACEIIRLRNVEGVVNSQNEQITTITTASV